MICDTIIIGKKYLLSKRLLLHPFFEGFDTDRIPHDTGMI